eukprot:280127-Pyramimonas_sp.AAC.1
MPFHRCPVRDDCSMARRPPEPRETCGPWPGGLGVENMMTAIWRQGAGKVRKRCAHTGPWFRLVELPVELGRVPEDAPDRESRNLSDTQTEIAQSG